MKSKGHSYCYLCPMSVRAILCMVVCLATSACKNEPYPIPLLGVTNLLNHDTGINNTYRYRDQKLYSFLSMASDTVAYMRFHHGGDDLESIVTDSTETSMKLTSFYYSGDIVRDSTFLIDSLARTLISARTITYDGDNNPVTVDVKTWTDTLMSEALAELTWDDGNVVRLVTSDLSTGEKVLIRDLAIGHDDQHCVYMKNNHYLFTLALEDLYWLSKNNPEVFSDISGPKTYAYSYNKFGYPSNFESDRGDLYGVAYTQVR